MTIGFLLNTCEPFYRGGYERRAWAFAREIARQGHDVRIYTSCPRDEMIEGVRFVRLVKPRKFFNARGVRNGAADLLFAFATLRLILCVKRGELDVLDVCATPFVHLPFVALATWLKRIPVVLTCHEALLAALPEYVRERGQTSPMRAALQVRLLAAIYRLGMGLFSNRLAVSHRTARALEAEGFPAQATVEFGLEPEAIAAQAPQARATGESVRLVTCGRLTPIKSVDQALAALPVGETVQPFRFDIIGEGSERARLERMAADAGTNVQEWITFHGELPEEQKRRLLARSDVFVLASPREGFAIAALEAMAQGCAALVVNDPSRPNGALDFVRDGRDGLVVAPGGLREGLCRLIGDGPELERLRHAAWKTAGEYRVDRQAERLLEAYRGAAKRT
jgi:glycosyltransferase involved in cell wall biosynthesis